MCTSQHASPSRSARLIPCESRTSRPGWRSTFRCAACSAWQPSQLTGTRSTRMLTRRAARCSTALSRTEPRISVSFETRPAVPEVTYDSTLAKEVSGLRLVEGTLEMLDDDGAPRLRATPPFIVGADGTRTDAMLAVEGCAVDTNPAGPWGRDVTPPGAETCTLRVRWPDEQVQYPAVLDPRWQTTGNMGVARQDYAAISLSTGKVLAAGGAPRRRARRGSLRPSCSTGPRTLGRRPAA